jgi:hypothetical protein
MRCKTVTQAVRGDSGSNTRIAEADFEPAANVARLQPMTRLSEEQARGLPIGSSSEKLWPTTVEIAPQRSRRVLTYGHNASAATLSFHAYLFLIKIYGGQIELDQLTSP